VGIWEYLSPDRALGGVGPIYPAHDQASNAPIEAITNSAGITCALQFDTYELAIGSSLAKIMYSAGYLATGDPDGAHIATLLHGFGYTVPSLTSLGWLDAAGALGYDITPWNDYLDDPETLYTDNAVDTTSSLFPGSPSVVHAAYAQANADGLFHAPELGSDTRDTQKAAGHICLNTVILGPARLCDLANPLFQRVPQPIRGFFMDWETDDYIGHALSPNGTADLFTVLALVLAAAAHGKGLLIYAGFDPMTGSGAYAGITQANAGIVLADATTANPGGGLDLVNIVTNSAPAPLAGTSPSDPQAQWLQTQLDFYQGAIPAIPNLASKILMQLTLDPPYQEISRLYSASARNFLIANGISNCSISNNLNKPGGALSRPFNQAIATFLGLPIF
jgi:hypothetical protein